MRKKKRKQQKRRFKRMPFIILILFGFGYPVWWYLSQHKLLPDAIAADSLHTFLTDASLSDEYEPEYLSAIAQPEMLLLPALAQNEVPTKHTGYSLLYDENYEQARWVAYRLTAKHLADKQVERTNDFHADTSVRSGSATLEDYRRSGYDRGHLIPAADQGWAADAMHESFVMSNMSPQVPEFNRGIWKELETQTRQWAKIHGELLVVTGPVLETGLKTIGKSKVAVPKQFYKVLFDYQPDGVEAIGFLMENKALFGELKTYAVTVDKVEELTGLDFFPSLPDEAENRLESRINTGHWFE